VAAAAPVTPPVLPSPAIAEPLAPEPARPIVIMPEPQEEVTPGSEDATTTAPQYAGYPISLDFKDGDLIDIFRLFADITGLNVVINPGVSGKVSLKLVEVPWDQALELILKTNGLGQTIDGNVLRIANLSDLQREEEQRRRLAEEKELAGETAVLRRTLAYATAQEMQGTIEAVALSPRGSITLDTRTNTMIITDLPGYLDKAKDLIDNLDRPTPQVEIEARIVVTTRNFTRDLGVQWGFNVEKSPRYGNATNLGFPNSIVIRGDAVPSTGGVPANMYGQADTAGIGQGDRGYAVNLPASGFNSALGVSMGNILGNFNLDAALTALERQGRGRLLSTPKITTQNNMAAEIKQGQQIPIQTVANNTVTVNFRDATLTLSVTPQITDAGTVILAVDVDNNSPDFANLVNGIPPINTQSARTNVLVKDGATAVIGGIYQSQEQQSQQNTPFLSKLPIFGFLFKNNFNTATHNELLIFITPRIIKG
jgi:type IV pilus assembly protein PilQ